MPGPLAGTKIIEIAGIGPGPFCAMMLADMGADVIRVDRAQNVRGGDPATPPADVLMRGRRSIGVDLKHPDGVETVLSLIESADGLIEGFRPGVMERLGLGPDAALGPQPAPRLRPHDRLGPGRARTRHRRPRHQLHRARRRARRRSAARAGRPCRRSTSSATSAAAACSSPSAWCAASSTRSAPGEGQVVDAAMVDGAAVLMTMFHAFRAMGIWEDERGTNLLDTGAHFYDVYETADGKYVSIGSIEPQFYAELLRITGLEGEELPFQHDKTQWPAMKERIAAIFQAKTRDEWCEIMEGTDVCFAPVLSIGEAPRTRTTSSAGTFLELDGVVQPAPAPRFSAHAGGGAAARRRTRASTPTRCSRDWGFDADRIAKLRDAGAVA